MPTYSYKGVHQDGKKVKGIEMAKSEKELYLRLKANKICGYDITETVNKKREFYKLTGKELCEFSRQVGTMQGAGIPINKSLAIIADCDIKPALKKVYEYLRQAVTDGHDLSEAMESCKTSFPELMINMYRAGEVGGRLEEAALKMEKYYESESKIRAKTNTAMAYPAILGVSTVTMVLVLFTYVLPIFMEIYGESQSQLHWITLALMNVSDFLIAHGILVMLGMIGLLIACGEVAKNDKVKMSIDKMKLCFPSIGKLLTILYTARFARTLSSLYSTGIPMMQAVSVANTTIGNTFIEGQIKGGLSKIKSGLPLSSALVDVEGLDKKLLASIYIGEESGDLEEMLNSSANQYEYEANIAVDRLLTLLEPALLIIMGLIIGPILVGIMLPMFNMYSIM